MINNKYLHKYCDVLNMNFKRIVLISLILCFLSLACVSASENQTSIENSNLNAVGVVDEDINEYDNGVYAGKNGSDGLSVVSGNLLSSSNVVDKNTTLGVVVGENGSAGRGIVSDNLLSISNSEDKLSASKVGTRDELNNLVLAAKEGSTITLDKDYDFLGAVKPIEITKSIVIDGKGHTITLGYNNAFNLKYVSSIRKIEIKNINFLRGSGGAIIADGQCPFIISNCKFINCSRGGLAGAISAQAKYNSQIIDCTFKGCYAFGEMKTVRWETSATMTSTASSSGGAISISDLVTVKSCRFEDCSAGDGGAINAYGKCQILDCVFVKNHAGRAECMQSYEHGGAIYLKGGSGALVKGCTFNENSAGRFGGAISMYANDVKIEDCVFNSNYVDDSVKQKGGAIFINSDPKIGDTGIQITRCTFNNNGYNSNKHYCKYGGAIYFDEGIIVGHISYCNFTGNGASKEGGAVYASSDSKFLNFKGCLFTKNQVKKYGGGIYLDSKSSTIVDCAFVEQPNAVYCDNKQCSVKFSTFLRNDNYDIWSTKEINIANNWFGNTMDNRYYDLAKLKGKAVNLNNRENLYLVAASMDKNYHNGQESTVDLNFRYMRDSPTSDSKLPPFSNPAIRYVVSGVNARVVSDNLYLANGKSSFKFLADPSKSTSSLTVDCYGAKLTLKLNLNPNSFAALQAAIDSSQSGVLNLTHDYSRDKSIDKDMSINILKNLVINGNGHTVDSKSLGNVFKIKNSNVNLEINNLNIVNCNSNYGAAIDAYADRVIINNCKFINCSAKFDGGAIKMEGNGITITNSTFINNFADRFGGSVSINCSNKDNVIRDCIFINSNSRQDGCFIYVWRYTNLNLANSILLTDSPTRYIGKPSDDPKFNVMFIENNWFGGTNDDILKNYDLLKNINVKNLLYLNVTPSSSEIQIGNSSKITLRFYSYDLKTKQAVPLTNFRNMKFGVKMLKEGGKLSSDSIVLTNNKGDVVYTSSSNGMMPIEIDYNLFKHRINLDQFYDGSFTALQYLINNSGNVINLEMDYTYSSSSDYNIIDGVVINKNLTINGNNRVIDANGTIRIFNIGNYNVVLNNITFVNGNDDNGGAILTSALTDISINHCRFENNSATRGGAIYLKCYKNASISSSVFKNNSATEWGGAIYYDGYDQNRPSCSISGTFINNKATNDGGAVYLSDVANYKLSGNFTNNTAKNGGAVYSHTTIAIKSFSIDGIFNSNKADYGGAVYAYSSSGNFKGTYQNNQASKDGGAIYLTESYMLNNITGKFYDNVAKGYGSAVCAEKIGNLGINLYESTFIRNGGGKATVYSSGYRYLNIHDSILINNTDLRIFDTSKKEAVDGRLKSVNNWFGYTTDNLNTKPSVGERVELNDWLFLDVGYGKTDVHQHSKNNIDFSFKSYDAKKGTISDYAGNIKINLSLKSNTGRFSNNSFILGNSPVKIIYIPDSFDINKVVVLANLSKYSYNVYEIKYNVVEHPRDSFYTLQDIIDHIVSNIINLHQNFRFYPDCDDPNGITINRNITINGNGYNVDGNGSSRIFTILSDNVVLENISLINGNEINGSAIYASGKNITIRNSILLNNFDTVIYATNPLNASYNWWGNTVDTFNRKANVSDNVVVDNALFASFNANSNIIGAGNKTTLTLNLTNLYDFNSKSKSTYDGLNLFEFGFNAVGGKINVTSDKIKKGKIPVSFEAIGPVYGEIYAKYGNVELKHEFEIIYDDDSFTALYTLINKTGVDGLVNLTHDYVFYDYDADYVNGIPIDKAVTINGNGFAISGMNQSSIFNISANNVSLKNIHFLDAISAVEWWGNNGLISNISVNNTYSALIYRGSNLVVRDSNFTRARLYSLNLEGSNHVVDSCKFVDNFGPSIIGYDILDLNITDSVFNNENSPASSIVDLCWCEDVNISDCIFNNKNNRSINILQGSTVYLANNNLSESDYIFNDGTILSKTFACLDDVNLNHMVGDVILLNATLYDDNNNIILVDEFNFKINDELFAAEFYIDEYKYLWTLTNGSWLVVPDISEKSFANCTVDSLIVNVLKYNSSVIITSIRDVIYGEDVKIGFEYENSTAVLVTVTINSEVVFNETTNGNNVSIPDLGTGFYNVVITTLENEFYRSSSVASDFRVNRAGSSLTLEEILDTYYGKDIIINFTVENRTSVVASIYNIDTKEFVINDVVEGNLFTINNLPVGSYAVTLTNIIDRNYNPSGDYAAFNVLKVNSSIILDNKAEYVYGNVVINYDIDNLTNVTVTVVDLQSGEVDNFTTTNSTINLDLDAGSYEITLVNVGTDNVFASQDSKTFFVLPANSSVEIDDIGDVYYGDDIEISFDVINATNVTVIVKDENNNVIYKNNTDESYFDLSDLAVGKYTVEVYNSGSNNFNPSNDTKTFYVLKVGSLIEFDYSNVTYYGMPFRLDYDVENETLLNICIYDSEGFVIFDKNFNEISELPEDMSNLTEEAYLGYYFFIYRNLTAGNYTFEFTNLGNSNISGSKVNGSFEIIKAPSYVEILVDSIVYGDDLEVYINVVNATTVNIIIKDDVGVIVYDENITSSPVIVSDLIPGNYTVIVTNYDTENIIGNSSSGEFCVYKLNSTVKLNNISDIYYEDAVLIEFGVENKTVINVRIQNQDGEVVYDNNVTSDAVLIPNLNVGNYTVTVTNLETFNISKSSDSKSFRVLKRSINITVVVEDNVYGELSVINVISDIDGVFPVNVGNQQLLVDVMDGYGNAMINLDAGNYTANVNYTDDNYDINMTGSSFAVYKADVALSVEVLDRVYTADVEGNVFASVDGEYTVVIGDNIVHVTVLNGIGAFNVGILNVGKYVASVIFNGSDNYNAGVNESAFEVTQSGTNFNIVANESDITYGNSINITQSLPADATGNITYFFADGKVMKVLNVGESFVLSGLDVGSYVVYANYSGDSNYAPARDSLTITVNKAVNNILVFGEDGVYLENSTIVVVADVDGVYAVNVSGKKVRIYVLNGIGTNTISLNAGNYSADVEYVNPNYVNNVTCIPFTVAKADVALSVEVLDRVYTADVEGNVFASVDGEYSVVIGDNSVPVTVLNGVGAFNVGVLDAGNYTVRVIFAGNDNYNGNANESTFKVTQSGTNFNIVANESEITYGNSINVTQSLPGDATGNITYFFANGTVIKVLNVGESFVLSGLDVGSYVVYANYSGDSNYAPARDSLTITVNKAVNNVLVFGQNVPYPENSTIIVVADVDGEYYVDVGGKLVIVNVLGGNGVNTIALDAGTYFADVGYVNANYVNNVTSIPFSVVKADVALSVEVLDRVYTADVEGIVFASVDGKYSVVIGDKIIPVTVLNGVGAFDVGVLDAGNYTVRVIFAGNENYNANVNESTFEVTRSGTNFNIVANESEITYGNSINVTQSLPGDATGNITYFFANGTVIKVLNVGESFVMPVLDVGSYVVYANYSGDSNYAPARDSLTITVNNAVNNVLVFGQNVAYPENSTITVVADVDGEYYVDVGGKLVVVNVLNGIGVNTIALDAGNYSADVKYVNPNYVNNVTIIPFTVAKAGVALSVEVLDVVYSADVDGNVFANLDGEYNVIIGDTLKVVNVKNGIGTFNFGILPVGNYDVYVIFAGNKNYNANSNSSTFKVTSTGTNFNVIANSTEITYGESIDITQTLPADATGNVTYRFANGTVINVVGVNESFVLSGLDAGSYVIYANYSGDSNYASALDSVTIVVNKAINNVVVSAKSVICPDNVTINVKADIDGIYIVSVGGNDLEVNVVNGKGSIMVSLGVGDYSTLTNIDCPNYETDVIEAKFTVLPVEDYDFDVKMIDKTVIFHAPSDATGNVTLVVGNITYVVRLENGTAEITVSDLIEGSNIVRIAYSGDSKYAPRSYSTDLIVNTKIVASDMTRGYNSGVDYQVKIVDNNGNPLKNKTVTFTVNNVKYVSITNAKGIAELNAKLRVGTYNVTVTLEDGKNVTKKLKIVKRIVGNKNVVKYYNSRFKYKFKVIGDNGKAVGKGVIVPVKIGKKTYKLKTNKKGYITFRLTKRFTPKKYTIKAAYKGYKIKNKIKVKRVIFTKKTFKVKKSSGKLVLKAKLKQGKKLLKYKKVTFKFKGKKYKVKTNKKGIAKLTIKQNVIKKLKVGKKYVFRITYLKSSIKTTVKVKR